MGQSLYVLSPEAYDVLKVDKAESVPNPFVISAPYPSKGEYGAGDAFSFSVTLFGAACAFEQAVVDGAKDMCKGKLANAQLVEVETLYRREWSDVGAESIPHCDALTINFHSPTEIHVLGQAVKQLEFALFIDRLFSRISSIVDNYGESEFVLPYSLVAKKPFVRAECDLRSVVFKTSEQPVSGILGQVRYFGDVTHYLPYIDLGSQIHIGKKTTRGCGEYGFEI